MRKCEVLSITTAPALAARGACTAETLAPGENSAMSTPLKSYLSRSLDLQDVVLAERNLAAGRARRGDGMHLGDREFPLGENAQHLAADIAGGADHRDLERHGCYS